MPLKTITNPQTGQTLQVADNALSPDTLNQYQAQPFGTSPMVDGIQQSPDMTSPAPAIPQSPAYPQQDNLIPGSMPTVDPVGNTQLFNPANPDLTNPENMTQNNPANMLDPNVMQNMMQQQRDSTPQPVNPTPFPMPFGVPQHGVMDDLEKSGVAQSQLTKENQLKLDQEASEEEKKKEPVFFNANQNIQGQQKDFSINDRGLASAFDKEKKAISAYGEASAEKALAEGKVYEESRQQMQAIAQNKEDMRMEYQKTFDDYSQKIESLTKEAAQGVNPRRYWKNKSAFGKIGAALSVMAGAIGTAINQSAGGRMTGNAALDIIMDQIDEDIQAQRTNLANKNQEVRNQQTMYGMAMNKFNNDMAAQEASRIALIDQTKMRLAEMTANATSEGAKAKTQQAMAQLDQKKAESQIKLDQFARQEAAREAQGIDRFVPGVGFAYDKESAKETRKFSTNYQTLRNTTQELMKLRKKNGASITKWPTKDKARLETLSKLAQVQANVSFFELGALSKDDLKFLGDILPSGADWGQALTKYETFLNTLDDRAENFYKTRVINYQGRPENDPRFNAK